MSVIQYTNRMYAALSRFVPKRNGFFSLMYSTDEKSQPVMKGDIAYYIPKLVSLENDKTYAWCSCGLSKKQPFCDGSHKNHPRGLKPLRFSPPKTGRFLLCRCKQTNNRPYCDATHVKTWIPEKWRQALKINL